MNFSETIVFDARQLMDLRKLVARGEGLQLEFKRKASFPDKIVRELIAFANTNGGIVLIGVGDDGSIPGIKYPEEELAVVRKAIEQHCRPILPFSESIIPLSEKKFVVRIDISPEGKRPYFFVAGNEPKICYVRDADRSIQASREMTEIIRRSAKKKDIQFTYGEAEQKLMQHLAAHQSISLNEFRKVAGLNRFMAARKLILLVLANVLTITPSEKGDSFRRRN